MMHGLQASQKWWWASDADSEAAVGELGTAPSQHRSVTSHCDGQPEWLRDQGYVQRRVHIRGVYMYPLHRVFCTGYEVVQNKVLLMYL